MPTYDYRCPNGHDFEHFFRKISDATAELTCPQCAAVAVRRVSGGAGLLFKGSGFYLTDYGKNAHRKGSDAGGGDSKGESAGGDTQPAKTESAKSDGSASTKSDSSSTPSGKSESSKTESSKTETKSSPKPKGDAS